VRTLRDMMDTYDAAGREAVLRGDGAIVDRAVSQCLQCGGWWQAVWFGSRGWVCAGCDEDVPGIDPTPAQRLANEPNEAALRHMLDEFRKGELAFRFGKI
jgi:hypothetical protein